MNVPRLHVLVFGLTAFAAVVVASASCTIRPQSEPRCDYAETQCRTVCSTSCDAYGCFPVCYDQCWRDCYVIDPPPLPGDAGGLPPAPNDGGLPLPLDASTSFDPAAPGGSADAGALCTTCRRNAECGAGALCIVPGGDAGAGGFCGRACSGTPSGSDCPSGYECALLGTSRQCVPASGTCN